ncbi:MAG: UbiA family prenyltransferase [Methanobrevibacter sp.]|jgi:geranylgeranylglycerol-phosphate geranylgeranyltransferase|nr:UbiA family prenyltransferase [Methanobrevibacter sp.]
MKSYLEILRPGNGLMAVIAVVLMGIISKQIDLSLILAIIAVFVATGGGNVINDVFDYKIDSINRPYRPIPSGRISLKTGKIYSVILFLIAIIIGITLSIIVNNILPVIIVFINCLLMYYYAKTLKSTVLVGNLLVAYLTGSCFVFGGSITGNIDLIFLSIFLGFFAFLMTLAREIIKDMEDKEGDEKEGVKTLPITYGLKISSILASIFIIVDCILSPSLYIFNVFNVYFLIPLSISLSLFFYSSFLILSWQKKENMKKASKLLKIGMFISFISFVIGSF